MCVESVPCVQLYIFSRVKSEGIHETMVDKSHVYYVMSLKQSSTNTQNTETEQV